MELDFAVTTRNEQETILLGEKLAQTLKNGSIIALYGDLGSGKTRLVKGICKGLGVEDMVNSPTFMIVNEYFSGTNGTVFHFDLYRLKTEDEINSMGFSDYMKSGSIILIEWPEHAERILPNHTIKIRLAHSAESEEHRWIKIERPKI